MDWNEFYVELKNLQDSELPNHQKVMKMKDHIRAFSMVASLDDLRKLNSILQTIRPTKVPN